MDQVAEHATADSLWRRRTLSGGRNLGPLAAAGSRRAASALVELVEQDGLRLPTDIVDCFCVLRIGMPVRVGFKEEGGAWAPVFRPAP